MYTGAMRRTTNPSTQGNQAHVWSVSMYKPVLPADAAALKLWPKASLYQARTWFLANQRLVGTMFAFNALNAIEQALESK